MAYFAWSKILIGAEVDKKTGIADKHEWVQPGEEVTPEKLHVDQEQFEEYITSGAVREYEYPDVPKGYQDSPLNFFRERIRRIETELQNVSGATHFGIATRTLDGRTQLLGNDKQDPSDEEVNTDTDTEDNPGQQEAGQQQPETVQI